MRPLTTQQRLTLHFTLYFSVLLLILGVLFIAIFRMFYLYQIRKDLTHEFSEVVVDHIGMDKQGVFFKKDKNGDTLRTHLFNDGVSALFYDKNLNLIRSYGVFETNKPLTDDRAKLITAFKDALKKNKVQEVSISWNGSIFTAYVTPLKYNSQLSGSMLLAKSQDELMRIEQSVLTVLGTLGGLGLLGSFLLGVVLTRNALLPLKKVISSIETTHLHKLQGKVEIKGNPQDDLVVLSHKFNEMLSRLDQMSARQREFIANASHELKTPLTRAILSLDTAMMQGVTLPPEVADAKQDLWDLNNLLEQLLVLGKVKEGGLPKGRSSIQKSLKSVLKRYESDLHLKQMSPELDVEDFSVSLPEEYVQILFSNLISNAIKFSPPSSGIFVAIDKKTRSFLVRDGGVGMSKEELTQLFERFYRGKSVRHSTRGYGLGLSLVKEICDGYGIKIAYDSEKGKGTKVTLTFPM